ncbi:PIG-L family deacetylase [Streptomyces sp. SP18CS02]|uniref:PIG-L family deacetylase n=1 Tax=Streptomyces sp. SP18CS02 TaxID=3002531 RepID=UPI002E762B64|nr:PIG-L family deacetylase [Streptomyces sp. SP18CS02]MEE1751319.1 PIG-L family deacetylase [Streptomyces sp. SP18CS02]
MPRRPPLLSRRGLLLAAPLAVLLGITGGTLALTAGSSDASDVPSRGVPEEIAVKPLRTGGEAVVQIMAHPDDDLFFMNPDTSQSIGSGNSLTSVYLTAGESDGRNARRDEPKPRADKAAYSEARQNGIRAAYAEMATGNRTSPWDRTSIATAGGARAELDTLRAKPQISLVWLQLREAGSIAGDRPNSLHGLWDGRIDALGSQLAAGSPVREDFSYDKAQVVGTLAGLLERFHPTFVRMMDPTPGRNEKTGKLSDHQDHMYGARFAQAALARYAEAPGRPSFAVQNYLGYSTGGLPHSLDPKSAGTKLHTLKTYAWTDHTDYCEDPAGCGDRKVAARPAGHGWAQSIRYTRAESTSWLQRGAGGELYAFSVLDGRLAVWRKSGTKPWTGPELQRGGGLDSGVTSVRLPDGRIAVFATRTVLGDSAADYRREVVSTVQSAPGGVLGAWRSLGSPERDDETATSDISLPAVLVDRAGLMTAYVRDGGNRLTVSAQRPDGGWTRWRPAGGTGLHGDPVAATDATGRGYVFAGTPKTVLAWTQTAAGRPVTGPTKTGLPPTTLALSASPDGDGVRLWFRKPDSGDVRTARFSGSGHASPVRELPGVAGYGSVGAAGDALALRGRGGGLATASSRSAAGAPVKWTVARPLFSGAPAATAEGVAAVGLDGRLRWSASER